MEDKELSVIQNSDMTESDDQDMTKDPLEAQKDPRFYTLAAEYWDKVPPTVDGVLGGFGHISTTDINGSESFIRSLFKMDNAPGHGRAVDCGAGIGRITKALLQKHFGKVDLVEQCQSFVDEAKKDFNSSTKIGNYYCMGLQDFSPPPETYDVIWCQWVLGHLTDDDLISYLQRMGNGLKKNGILVLKENISADDIILDEEDSSVTRPIDLILELISKANLKVVRNVLQRHFPKVLFQVRMLALRV